MTCPCAHTDPPPPESRIATGHLTIDREALRRELGGRAEIVEALPVKASGRPSANASVLWGYYAESEITLSSARRHR